MKAREIVNLGYEGPIVKTAITAVRVARAKGQPRDAVRQTLQALHAAPDRYKDDAVFGPLARELIASYAESRHSLQPLSADGRGLSYAVWGEDIDEQAHQQMRNACRLPISVAAALMPDAHLGYGLPIGGVLATDNAVIPYAVGVDIACRMMLTVFDLPPEKLKEEDSRYRKVIEDNTRFGVGSEWRPRRQHEVMDADWSVTPVTARLKDLAHRQLGTSGSGNHFVEFGEIEFAETALGVAAGRYLAVLSHSGSRGPGARVADYYSKWAMSKRPELPRELRHLAWLDLDGDGDEYWAAMELMGRFASANHHIIHQRIVRALGESPLLQVENHHNFAWRERHGDRDVIVHRKGATPAGPDVLGIIPGSMAAPGYLVRGKGNTESLHSASHGAGRRMSRKEAIRTYRWNQIRPLLEECGVKVISAGLDEVPHVYKDIDEVMAAQRDLVAPIARFMPRLVKMAPAGERPED